MPGYGHGMPRHEFSYEVDIGNDSRFGAGAHFVHEPGLQVASLAGSISGTPARTICWPTVDVWRPAKLALYSGISVRSAT